MELPENQKKFFLIQRPTLGSLVRFQDQLDGEDYQIKLILLFFFQKFPLFYIKFSSRA